MTVSRVDSLNICHYERRWEIYFTAVNKNERDCTLGYSLFVDAPRFLQMFVDSIGAFYGQWSEEECFIIEKIPLEIIKGQFYYQTNVLLVRHWNKSVSMRISFFLERFKERSLGKDRRFIPSKNIFAYILFSHLYIAV